MRYHSFTHQQQLTSTTILNNLFAHKVSFSLIYPITHSEPYYLTHSTMSDSPSYSPPFTHSDTHSLPDLPMDVLLYTLQFQWPLLGCTLLEDMSEAARRSCVCV
jgi:hypothetical protein